MINLSREELQEETASWNLSDYVFHNVVSYYSNTKDAVTKLQYYLFRLKEQ